MDCLHIGGWLPSTSKGRPAFHHYLRRSSIPHRRSRAQSPDRTSLLSHHHHHRCQSYGMDEPKSPTAGDNSGGFGQNGSNKRHQFIISSRGLKTEDLKKYLELAFTWFKMTDEHVEKRLSEKYVLTLPMQLSPQNLQDIDFLRGDGAEEFLDDLEAEGQDSSNSNEAG